MEIGLNKQENTKTSEFVNFSIREYVAEIRKKDWKKCWPFGSLGDPDKYDVFASYQSVESSSFLRSQNCPSDHIDSSDDKPEHKEASNSSNKQTFNGKDDRSQTTDMIESPGINDNMCRRIQSTMVAQNRPGNSGSGDNSINELGRNQPRRKHHRVRLLSDILKNLDNANTKFTAKSQDDAFSRKQKGVKVTTMSKKKMITDGVQEFKFEKEEKFKCGSKDSRGNVSNIFSPVNGSRKIRNIDDIDMEIQTIEKRKKVGPQEENDTETGNEDSEMEAVMLLAMHFNEVNPSIPSDDAKRAQILVQSNMEAESLEASNCITSSPLSSGSGAESGFATGTTCACVKKKIRGSLTFLDNKSIKKISSKTATQDPTIYLECSINRNPADFSIPNAKNLFMRGG